MSHTADESAPPRGRFFVCMLWRDFRAYIRAQQNSRSGTYLRSVYAPDFSEHTPEHTPIKHCSCRSERISVLLVCSKPLICGEKTGMPCITPNQDHHAKAQNRATPVLEGHFRGPEHTNCSKALSDLVLYLYAPVYALILTRTYTPTAQRPDQHKPPASLYAPLYAPEHTTGTLPHETPVVHTS